MYFFRSHAQYIFQKKKIKICTLAYMLVAFGGVVWNYGTLGPRQVYMCAGVDIWYTFATKDTARALRRTRALAWKLL